MQQFFPRERDIFYAQLLDYSILLRGSPDKLNHYFITLHNHELIQRLTQKQKRKIFTPQGFETWSLGADSQCAINELRGPLN